MNPARSRHCDRATKSRMRPLERRRRSGKARLGARSQETYLRPAQIDPRGKGASMTDRTRQAQGALAGVAIAAALFTAAPALATPVSVNLRVEGKSDTIFEGPVTTDGHDVTTTTGGTHKCDGTNGGSEPAPGPDRARRARRRLPSRLLHLGRQIRQLRHRRLLRRPRGRRHHRPQQRVLGAVHRRCVRQQGRLPAARPPGRGGPLGVLAVHRRARAQADGPGRRGHRRSRRP